MNSCFFFLTYKWRSVSFRWYSHRNVHLRSPRSKHLCWSNQPITCWSNQTTWVTHKHYRTYETVAVHITMYNCTSTLIQVNLYIVHSSTSTTCEGMHVNVQLHFFCFRDVTLEGCVHLIAILRYAGTVNNFWGDWTNISALCYISFTGEAPVVLHTKICTCTLASLDMKRLTTWWFGF